MTIPSLSPNDCRRNILSWPRGAYPDQTEAEGCAGRAGDHWNFWNVGIPPPPPVHGQSFGTDTGDCSLHPSVLEKFEIPYPVSAVELNLEAFL